VPCRFYIVDVFTRQPFGGNQLAVFPDAEGLAPATMQLLAREFNFAETTFVLPAADPTCTARVRIFTPRAEVPFAGHPTIGTTAVLAALGRLPASGGGMEARLEEGIGPVAVEARTDEGPTFARLTIRPRLETPGGAPATAAVAKVLSLAPELVSTSRFAGVGLPFCLVRLVSREAVDSAVLDRTAWSETFGDAWAQNIYLFAGELASGSRLYARMFAPALGVDEDPATGSAAATLAAVTASALPDDEATCSWHIEQGVRMGRPSVILAGALRRGGRVHSVSVGGHSVIVAEGEMTGCLPVP
jgi:trans-2,3-dihydro-3-hydroxyanthranilate isomerase